MFRNYPYRGWLIAALLFWATAWFSDRAHHQKFKPASVAAAVRKGLWERDAEMRSFLKEDAKVGRLLRDQVDNALYTELSKKPFHLFVYFGDSLVYWNRDDLLPPADTTPDTAGRLVNVNNQYCIRKVFTYPQPTGPSKALVFLQTLSYQYSFQNDYLRPYVVAAPDIGGEINVLERPAAGTYPMMDASGKHYWCSLEIIPEEGENILPSYSTIVLTLIALGCSFLWFQLLILHLTRKRGWPVGIAATALLILILRATFYNAPLPFHLKDLDIFSPDIYAASKLLPSLGDLLVNELCLMWLLVFMLMETPYKEYLKDIRHKALKIGLAALLIALLLYINHEVWGILHSLVIDSQIIFDVSHLHSVDQYTIIGLLSIALGVLITEMSVRLINSQLKRLIPRRYVKQLIVAVLGVSLVAIFQPGKQLQYINILWLAGYMFLLDIRRTRTFSNILSLPMIFVSLFTCACVTVKLHYLIQLRDIDKDRISFASHLLAQQDRQMEYQFKGVKGTLRKDARIADFFRQPTSSGRADLVKRLNLIHLDELLNRYETDYYFYDSTGNPLNNPDTASYSVMAGRYAGGFATLDSNLFFNESNGSYLSHIRFGHEAQYLGSMFIIITPRKTVNETVYPELLQPTTISRVDREEQYDYALYVRGKLISQTNDYTFPILIDTTYPPSRIVKKKNGIYELYYKDPEAPGKSVIVAGRAESWLSAGVLMSYLFGLHLLLSLIAIAYRGLFRALLQYRTPGYHLTLSRRIHFSMQTIVLTSFFIVGVVTIMFFEKRYQTARQTAEHQTTLTISRFARQYLATQGGLKNVATMDSVVQLPEFQYGMANVAANEKVDANIFSTDGKLLLATQEDIYNEGLLAPIMHPDAFRQLRNGSPVVEVEECVGSFLFLSCYTPLKNDDGVTLGYISVPFFSSEKELSDQISNIIVALINIYALLFLLSSLLGLFIISRITRTFNLLIGKFEQLSLQKNELIEWPYDDEIGKLVKEYNNMARKVEENATLLAQSEREGAWREMAKQVAHEIKNPLTPMKLNIQYLQNALKNKHPDVESLAARVSSSIIEQIDNLSYIASEFSNFAKMPEANPEVVVLNELLGKAVALYQNKPDIDTLFISGKEELKVLADKSQLLRVFTNLLQNAVQAIPSDERHGDIEVRLAQEGNTALITFKDNGTGIPEEVTDRIFKPYFTTKSSGTGLGLAMTRKIIELWKGHIWFESVPDKGTTFFVRLPLVEND